jgi:hypothetical protein
LLTLPMFARALLVASVLGWLAGCGIYTPDIELSNEPHATAFLINKILNHVKCEVRSAVIHVVDYDTQNAKLHHKKRDLVWLDSMVAKITLKLIVDEKGTLNPGVTFKQPLPSMQSYSTALGALLSSDATRTENFDYTYVISKDFLHPEVNYVNRPKVCVEDGGILLNSDLKVDDWLFGVTLPYYLPNNVDHTAPDVLTHEVAFVVVASGSVTPSWSLVRVSANTAGSLAAAARTSTGDVIVSLAPAKTAGGPLQDAQNIAKINSGFNSAIKGNPLPD